MIVVLKCLCIVFLMMFILLTMDNIIENRQVPENIFNLIVYIMILVYVVIGGVIWQ